MSGADTESRAGAAGYDQVLKKVDQSVASFEEDAETPLRRLQHFLHAHPTAIPAFVLVLAIILFSFIAGSRFLHPFKDRKSTRLNSSHSQISYAVFCLKKKKKK